MASRRLFNSKPNYIYPNPESFDSVTTDYHFEFDEADVYNVNESLQLETKKSKLTSRSKKNLRKIDDSDQLNTVASASLPMNVPDWSKILKEDRSCNHQNRGNYGVGDNSDQDDGIPPHEYLARVRGASLSVHEGIGRTLKGRDLSCVRNAIWQKTGFAD